MITLWGYADRSHAGHWHAGTVFQSHVPGYGRKGFHKGYNRQIIAQGQGMAACKPDGPSCACESGQELHLVDQQPLRQDLHQLS